MAKTPTEIFRDFETDGVPSSGPHSPIKADVRDLLNEIASGYLPQLTIFDGITAPSTISGRATIYVDAADGDLKIKYANGTVKTIVVDT